MSDTVKTTKTEAKTPRRSTRSKAGTAPSTKGSKREDPRKGIYISHYRFRNLDASLRADLLEVCLRDNMIGFTVGEVIADIKRDAVSERQAKALVSRLLKAVE